MLIFRVLLVLVNNGLVLPALLRVTGRLPVPGPVMRTRRDPSRGARWAVTGSGSAPSQAALDPEPAVVSTVTG